MNPEQHLPASDEVDHIVAAWQGQRPDFDAQPLALFSRLLRLGRHLDRLRRATFADFGLETWEFEMLSALRRQGEPFQLTAGQLMQETLVSSGTITNRIDRMVDHGFVKRMSDPADKRVVYVVATERGIEAVDGAMEALLIVEHQLLEGIAGSQRDEAVSVLRTILERMDSGEKR
ncbi:MarR family winged helix-turn-helix transcriptional regulator [Arcanobacterium bovis]|uniref:MarR family transcriptional regulator n=1 Tax=Arcanobacterium bovis TaxID=2529275 RepID=A0A4Q9V264_9ACTO|nr:MarR family transcriptional regulator [Arcanobacterium bovis]TBW23729.1 MarR family transcriptional regulator [Arcanobacterium bovis]